MSQPKRLSTLDVAEYMLYSEKFYTAATLSRELGIPINTASGKLYNIKKCKKYETIEQGRPIEVRVCDIDGVQHHQRIWRQILSSDW